MTRSNALDLWCNNFGNVMTTTMTRLFKCNFNFKTSIGHHLSSFCHQSLIGPERDKGHIISDSVVIVSKNTAIPPPSCFYARIQSSLSWMFWHDDECQVHIFKVRCVSYLYLGCRSFSLFVTFLTTNIFSLTFRTFNCSIWIFNHFHWGNFIQGFRFEPMKSNHFKLLNQYQY